MDQLRITRDQFDRRLAAEFSDVDRRRLWAALTAPEPAVTAARAQDQPMTVGALVAFYLGAMLVIMALTWFLGSNWETLTDVQLLVAAVACTGGALWAAHLFRRSGWTHPAGVVTTIAVCCVPLLAYAVQKVLGVWPTGSTAPGMYEDYYTDIHGGWTLIELSTMLAAAAALRRWPFPFLVAPLAFSVWFAGLDAAELVFGRDISDNERAFVAFAAGVAMVAAGTYLDGLRRRAYASFLHWFGLLSATGGLTVLIGWHEIGWLVFGGLGAMCVFWGAAVRHSSFMIFGAVGVVCSVGYACSQLLPGLMPLLVCGLGVGVICAGVWWQREHRQLRARLLETLPEPVRRLADPNL